LKQIFPLPETYVLGSSPTFWALKGLALPQVSVARDVGGHGVPQDGASECPTARDCWDTHSTHETLRGIQDVGMPFG